MTIDNKVSYGSLFKQTGLAVDSCKIVKEKLKEAAILYLEKNYDSAKTILDFLVAAGSPAGQFMLGRMYERGRGVKKCESIALELYEKAGEKGITHAKINSGWMKLEGRGCEKNGEEAVKYFKEAAKDGRAGAAEALAWMKSIGNEVEIDYIEAYAWANIGLELGSSLSSEYIKLLEKVLKPEEQAIGMSLAWLFKKKDFFYE